MYLYYTISRLNLCWASLGTKKSRCRWVCSASSCRPEEKYLHGSFATLWNEGYVATLWNATKFCGQLHGSFEGIWLCHEQHSYMEVILCGVAISVHPWTLFSRTSTWSFWYGDKVQCQFKHMVGSLLLIKNCDMCHMELSLRFCTSKC